MKKKEVVTLDLKNKTFRILSLCTLGLISSGCYNTTVPQFSETIAKAKANKTFVKEYVCRKGKSSDIDIGEAWVEKIWFYERFGVRTIKNNSRLYISIRPDDSVQIQDFLFNIKIVASGKDSNEVFENPKAGYKGIGETELWAEIPFKKDLVSFPDTLRFNVYDKRKHDTSSVGSFVLVVK